MTNLSALKQLTLTRFRVLVREPEIVFWVFIFPALLALGLGVAFADSGDEVYRIALEGGSGAEAHLDALVDRPELSVVVLNPRAAEEALRRGEVALVVGNGAPPVLRFDPTRPEGQVARLLADAAIQRESAGGSLVPVRFEEIRQRGSRYVDWLIPGLIGFNLMSTGLWVVGFFVTQARQTKQLKRLVATPMRQSDFLLAQVLARFAFLIVEVPLLVLFAWYIFGVAVVGNPAALAAIVVAGAACFTGLGLLVSSRARTTEGVGGLINLVILPMVVLSGVFFSPARFPDAVQPIIRALPLTALNDALRSVYNEGLPLASTAPELAILAAWGTGAFLVALRVFRWQ